MVRKYTDAELLQRVEALESFKGFPTDFWILGVRSKADLPDKFDDKFYLYEGKKFHLVTTGTTHPGLSILKGGFKRYNKKGGAVVHADKWYYNVWKYGLHKKLMPALLQIGAKIDVHRDGDLDNKSEQLGDAIAGWYGINFHANTYDMNNKKIVDKIAGWSAGCQVVNNTEKYVQFIEKCKAQKSVSYCLINEF